MTHSDLLMPPPAQSRVSRSLAMRLPSCDASPVHPSFGVGESEEDEPAFPPVASPLNEPRSSKRKREADGGGQNTLDNPNNESRLAATQRMAIAAGRDASFAWVYDAADELVGATCDGVWFGKAELSRLVYMG